MTDSLTDSLNGRIVLVVGGTSGLGLSAARALSRAGARVVVTGRGREKVDAAVRELGGESAGLAADAAAPGSAEAAVALAVERFGRLDALYHVAGGSGRSRGDGALHEVTDEGIDYTLDLNLKSVLRSNRAAVRQFLAQGDGGAILNMGSVLAFSPSPEFFSSHIYAATKAGILGFSKSLAARYARDNIRVNVLAPALVETPMSGRAANDAAILDFIRRKQPLDGGRIGRPDDLDAAALFFLSDASRFATGQVLAIDGGWSVSEGH